MIRGVAQAPLFTNWQGYYFLLCVEQAAVSFAFTASGFS
jgi:hypothetical protein